MKLPIILLLVASTVQTKEVLRNVGYLAAGYNIYYGNPKSTTTVGADLGFQAPIFRFSYSEGKKTDDGTYMVPDRTSFRKNIGCASSFTVDSIQGIKSYVKSLGRGAITKGGFKGVAFSASQDFKKVKSTSLKYRNRFTSSQSVCVAYDGYLDHYLLPNFTSDFQAAVESLPVKYKEGPYTTFLEHFGTHFVHHAKMGAMFGFCTEFTDYSWRKMLSWRINIEDAAAYAALFSVSSVSVSGRHKQLVKTFIKHSVSQSKFSIGSKPLADGKPSTWQNHALEEPMPIEYDLLSLSELFTIERVGQFRKDYASLKENIETALGKYCETLLKKGIVSTCGPLTDDPPIPVVENSCRLCAGKCGGYFPVDGGALSVNTQAGDFTNWFVLYPEECEGNLGNYDLESGTGARLCCESRDNSHIGNGRLCLSCGGNYPYFGGKIMCEPSSRRWVSVYDNNCNGGARNRDSDEGISMCFAERPLCELCASCGSNFPQETSVLSLNRTWPNFFRIKSEACSGDFSNRPYKDGVSLCCKSMGPIQ